MENVYFGIVKMLAMLAVIVFGMIILYRYGRKQQFRFGSKQNAYGLKKASSIHLGLRTFVSVVEVDNYVLVVGSSDREMHLLAKWKKEEEKPE